MATYWCCGILLLLSAKLITAQVISGFSGNSSRVPGHGTFFRSCTAAEGVLLEWQFNGRTVISTSSSQELQLAIDHIREEDAGEYFCIAHFGNGSNNSISGGFLNIYSADLVETPAIQHAVAGENFTLQCSTAIPGTSIRWRRESGSPFIPGGILHEVTLNQSGQYECVVIETASGGTQIYTTMSELLVLAPPTITSKSPVKAEYGNEMATFMISFMSIPSSNTTVTWLLNNTPLSDRGTVSTQYTNDTAGQSTLQFVQLTRADGGLYTVLLHNTNQLIPPHRRSVNTSFQVNVEVSPSPPSAPVITPFENKTLSRVTWNLTNQTADSGADYVVVSIEAQNRPKFEKQLIPSIKELLIPTEPGVTYFATVTAHNVDDFTRSTRVALTLEPEAPLIADSAAIRLNQTAFNFTFEVVYTGAGGGGLTLTDIVFRERETQERMHHTGDVELTQSRQQWYGVITNSNFARLTDVEFSLTVQNTMNLEVPTTAFQMLLVPGPPDNVNVVSARSDSLTVQARLSTVGTAPIHSVHFVLTGPDNIPRTHNLSEGLVVGGVVEKEVGQLSPDTFYGVVVYATNSAGRGQDSPQMIFRTSPEDSVLPLWIILVIAVVGSLALVILLLLLLISCCCRRRGDRKINTSYNVDRPGPLGASDSIDSIHAASSTYYSQKSMQGFVLGPVPAGIYCHSPTNSALHAPPQISYNEDFIKPRFQNSISESESSEQSSSKLQHFNFHHSPVAPRVSNLHFDKTEYSRSMPVLDIDDAELSPTMPPNCATDV